jgi:hypothetical protein
VDLEVSNLHGRFRSAAKHLGGTSFAGSKGDTWERK